MYLYTLFNLFHHFKSKFILKESHDCFVAERPSLSVMELFALFDEMLNIAVFALFIFSG